MKEKLHSILLAVVDRTELNLPNTEASVWWDPNNSAIVVVGPFCVFHNTSIFNPFLPFIYYNDNNCCVFSTHRQTFYDYSTYVHSKKLPMCCLSTWLFREEALILPRQSTNSTMAINDIKTYILKGLVTLKIRNVRICQMIQLFRKVSSLFIIIIYLPKQK